MKETAIRCTIVKKKNIPWKSINRSYLNISNSPIQANCHRPTVHWAFELCPVLENSSCAFQQHPNKQWTFYVFDAVVYDTIEPVLNICYIGWNSVLRKSLFNFWISKYFVVNDRNKMLPKPEFNTKIIYKYCRWSSWIQGVSTESISHTSLILSKVVEMCTLRWNTVYYA